MAKSFSEYCQLMIEEVEKSKDMILQNTTDWDDTVIDQPQPGAFTDEELTDAGNVTANLENPLLKDVADTEETPAEEEPAAEPECGEVADDEEEEEDPVFLHEAKMADIPHEIDDHIHELGDMRQDLEKTQKNWKLSGIDTKPLDDIFDHIDDLVATLYSDGAEMADSELSKTSASEESDDEEESEEKEEVKEAVDGDKEGLKAKLRDRYESIIADMGYSSAERSNMIEGLRQLAIKNGIDPEEIFGDDVQESVEVKESAFDKIIRTVLTEKSVSVQTNPRKTPDVFDVEKAIKSELDEKFGRSLIVVAKPCNCTYPDCKCFEVTEFNGEEKDLPKSIIVCGIDFELKDMVYCPKHKED